MVQHLLNIVESEATEDGKATVQPDVLGKRQGADGGGGKDERSETRDSNDGDTSKQRSTEIEVLVVLCSSTNEGNRSHHGNRVETSAGHNRRRSHEHQRRNERSLGNVERSPQSVLLDIVRWIRVPCSDHSTKAQCETTNHHDPWVRSHDTVYEARGVHGARCNADDADTEPSVHEGLVKVRALEGWHSTVLARLAVEHHVDGKQSATEHGATNEEALHQTAVC